MHSATNPSRTFVCDILTEAGIDNASRMFDAYPHMLSGGERQRVLIATALANNPKLIIADEPTSSLDTDRRDDFLNLLDEVLQGATLLFVSHDLSLASHFDQTLSLKALNGAAQ